MNSSFSTRIAAYFGGLFVATMSLVFALWYFGLPQLGMKGAKGQWLVEATHGLEILADHQRTRIVDKLEERRGDLLILAENKSLSKAIEMRDSHLQQDIERIFDRLVRARPDRFQEILILDPQNGKILASSNGADLGTQFADISLVKRARQPGASELIEETIGKQGPTLAIVRQIYAQYQDGQPSGKVIGILFVVLDPQNFLGEGIASFASASSTIDSTVLLNTAGQILVSQMVSGSAKDLTQPLLTAKITSGFEGTIEQFDAQGNEYLAVYRHLPLSGTQGWTLIHFRDKSQALASLKNRALNLALVGLALTLLSLIWIVFAARRLTQPLRALAETAKKLGDGQFMIKAETGPNASREIIGLVQAFNQTAEHIQTAHDTLESKVTERTKELARERNTVQRYLDIAGVMLIVFDINARIVMINHKGVEILGLPENRLIGMNWFESFLPMAEQRIVGDVFSQLIAGNSEFIEHFENRIFNSASHEVWISWNNVLLKNEAGEITGILSSGEDITARKMTEIELIRHRDHLEERVRERTIALSIAKEAAETANQAKSSFLANMSHELRTPMDAIIGLTHMLARNNIDPGQRDKLSKINGAANHLLSLLNDVLDLSKIEANKLVLENTPFRVDLIVSNIESLSNDKLESKSLQLVERIAPGLNNLSLLGDSLRLQQVLLNFVGNAIKFTERGVITITAEIRENDPQSVLLYFEVSDTGIGIADDALPRLFAPFEQADGSTTRKFGGTGLGLAISKRLIHLMGGEVGVRSVPGTGSTFWFTVRCNKSDSQLKPALAPAPNSGAKAEDTLRRYYRHARILLAEDDWVNQEVAMELLSEVLGLHVDLAVDGEKAVEMIASNKYDLILMDVQMPNLDGIAATGLIRQMKGMAYIPILAMTANAFEEDRQKCLAAGMNDFITKPVDPDVLFSKLLHWLEKTITSKSTG